mmetsp:Transcript_55253/g.145449  ORF Transcript_55253/g.145449 Transcript_55253/m.145449 type:complete len:321 (-) Transcript_55253:14-976(-)
MPIDYSKFDKIEDSDDEKEEQAASEPAKAVKAEKPACRNCGKDIVKSLRCSQCKAVEYCSAQCQKDDWPYHKRNCKKPEEKKPEEKEKKPSPPRPSEKKESRPKKEDVVKDDDDEEKFDWYRHREWKPTAEPKKEFAPTALAGDAAELASKASPPKAGSAWNAAGTWEDKDVTSMALSTFKEQLQGFPSIDAAGGAIEVTSVDNVEGEASKPVIRGTMRHLFDLSFKLKVVFKWMDSGGQQKLEGEVTVLDFTNDVFHEGDSRGEPVVQLALPKGRLDQGRQQALEAAVGAGAWPPKPDSLLGHVAAKMEAWVKDYEQTT